MEMTPKVLKGICRSLDLYQTPELNDKLYLHYKAFSSIQNLEPYTGLKVLYLEGNTLTDLHGLEAQTELRCLYLQENRIESIDTLAPLPQLSTLNLNQNFIASLPSTPLVERYPVLHTLSLKANRLSTLDSIACLHNHPTLSVLDLSANRFDSPSIFPSLLTLLSSLPSLRVLYLSPLPLIPSVSNYRKTVLSALTQLTYLDDRPVFDEERRLVTGWSKGGVEGEREEKQRMREEEKDKSEKQWQWFDDMVKQAKQTKEAESDRGQEEKEQMTTSDEVKRVEEEEVEEVKLDEEMKVKPGVAAVKAWGNDKSATELSGGKKAVHSLLSQEEMKTAGKGKMLIEVIGDDDIDA